MMIVATRYLSVLFSFHPGDSTAVIRRRCFDVDDIGRRSVRVRCAPREVWEGRGAFGVDAMLARSVAATASPPTSC